MEETGGWSVRQDMPTLAGNRPLNSVKAVTIDWTNGDMHFSQMLDGSRSVEISHGLADWRR